MPISQDTVNARRAKVNADLRALHGSVVTREQLLAYKAKTGIFPVWIYRGARAGRGQYRIPPEGVDALPPTTSTPRAGRAKQAVKTARTERTVPVAPATPVPLKSHTTLSVPEPVRDTRALVTDANAGRIAEEASKALGVDVMLGDGDSIPYIPARNPQYVPWGEFDMLRTLIASGHFLPVMVVGPSGNGKSDLCEQVTAALGREYVRANITNQTDEDDLLGGFRLINGNTYYALGPVPLAMLRGAVLNLDEIDLGGAALMCLQPVLEGKPLYLKKIGKYIQPAKGFTVVATANTKGRGDDGRYMHTNIMNDAMLERFSCMIEQGWPDETTERKILSLILKQYDKYDATLVKHLVEWARVSRNNFNQQVLNDQIATRRLLHIVRTYCALNDINAAVNTALARFDTDTATALRNMWKAIHDTVATSPSGATVDLRTGDAPPF